MVHPITTTEAIVLKTIPFRDSDLIITLFTPEEGIVKILQYGGRASSKKQKGICTPLTGVEVTYRERQGEIFGCQNLECIETFPLLRRNLTSLETGCDLLQAILDSQLPGKQAPHLYALLLYYFSKIPSISNPRLLSSSFKLKLLKHDGLAAFPLMCSDCGTPLSSEAFIQGAEGWCSAHRPVGSQRWGEADLYTIERLTNSQSFQEISTFILSESLWKQITHFFHAAIIF